ncbi:HAD family phosphatase [Streptomyces sp. NBC_01515]|uniref:HAD family hydrolase n=1 Tax=Streptomyces sp. NBC_01515 TaxID=2903890 RepID=UPI0038638E84
MTPVLRATVFDLDDTLIDTADAWPRVCADFTARHGHPWRPQDTAALHGNGSWASYVAGLCGGTATTAEVVDTCTTAMVGACAAGEIRALPGAIELVLEAERHGPVGVATASPRRFVRAALEHLGLAKRLRAVVCGEDVARVKPAPDPYLRAAAELGVPSSWCLAVEDSPAGIRSAIAADMHVLAIPRSATTLPDSVAHLPTAQARTATEALPLLTRLLTSRPAPLIREETTT